MTVIRVNGVKIGEAEILAEAQNHPAAAPAAALAAAAEALAVRQLLLQEAERLRLAPDPVQSEDGRREAPDDALIRQLIERQVSIPEPDEQTCRRYFERNPAKFHSPELYEASHILFAAPREDMPAYDAAVRKAEETIQELKAEPKAFARLARERSDCSSSVNGGSLGQISRGDTVPEFETFLHNLEQGQLCPVPVKSRYGAHVLRLDRKILGRRLPFESVRERIEDYLCEASYRQAVSQFIQIIAGRAVVEGIDLKGARTPLVQ